MSAYTQAVKQITDRRRDDLDNGAQKLKTALAEHPDLRAAYVAYQDEAVKHAQKLPNSLEAARAALAEQMRVAGISREDVEPPCRCKKCNDTGYANGAYCDCVIKRVIRSEKDNLVLPLYDFKQKKASAPKAIAKLYAAAEKYIDSFPDGEKPFFVIAGSSGTGKTVLAASIASELLMRGASAVTVSAFELVKRAKDYHTQFAIDDYTDLFTPMLDCDVLVIDDLGTETLLKNITREYLYTVINERWLRKKFTVITTNLSPNQMIDRYGEAVFSRMCDKSAAHLFTATAPNARLKSK